VEEAWSFSYSISCATSPEFAWKFWTNVANWTLDADVVAVSLDGPFRQGARGVTESRSSGRIEWVVAELEGMSAVLEFPAPGATGRFAWTFAPEGSQRVRMTQRASLAGPQALSYVESFGRGLEAGLPDGMKKLRDAIECAASKSAG